MQKLKLLMNYFYGRIKTDLTELMAMDPIQRLVSLHFLLHQLGPDECKATLPQTNEPLRITEHVLAQADKLGCQGFLTGPLLLMEGCFNITLLGDLFMKFALQDFKKIGTPYLPYNLDCRELPVVIRHDDTPHHLVLTLQPAYRPLNKAEKEIRLLYLPPNQEGTAQIYAYLVHVSLEKGIESKNGEQLSFTALSYTWGEAQPSCKIYLDNKRVPAGPNLYGVLKYLRSQKSAFIWVDALCIDQSDTSEKSHQISLMSLIYHNARKTIMWLGEPSDDSDLAFSLLSKWQEASSFVFKRIVTRIEPTEDQSRQLSSCFSKIIRDEL